MEIPLVDLRKQYAPLKDDILGRIAEILEGMHLFLGPNVQALEQEFAAFCGVPHAIGVSDGTTALQLALMACGVGAGDEVITVSHTFVATAEAIILVGATPVFVDIDPQTYTIDVGQVGERITERTKAIIPVHLYGQTADMDPLLTLAREHGLWVIEDACQAHGARYKGQRAGALGDAAAFSFYYSKNLGAYGEGGMVTTTVDEIAERVRMLRDHGSKQHYHHDLVGMNGRLDEIQAAVLRAKLPYLDRWSQQRRAHARQYRDALMDLDHVVLPAEARWGEHVYHLFVIRVKACPERSRRNRDGLRAYLHDRGISTGIHYPIPIHLQPAYRDLGYDRGSFPVTEDYAEQILSLPMYAELTPGSIEYVAETIRDFGKE